MSKKQSKYTTSTKIMIKTFKNLIGYIIFAPISYFTPKKNYIVLASRFGDFEGNLKYLFLYLNNLSEKDIEFVFLTGKDRVFDKLEKSGFNVWKYGRGSTFLKLLQTRIVIVDGNEWAQGFKPFFLFNTKKVQIWHGTGLKTIGLLKPTYQKLSWIHKAFRKESTVYDLLALSSEFQVESRGKAFNYKDLMINGLPRNDVFFNQDKFKGGPDSSDREADVFDEYKENGYKVVTYTPTWRKHQTDFHQLELDKLDDFAEKNRIKFVIKLHYKHECELRTENYKNIIEYNKHADIYPLLAKSDLMITDYSSIYLDYLLLDKPILFFPYDSEEYIDGERALLLDYDESTPGPKSYNQQELQLGIFNLLVEGKDNHKEARNAMRNQFFKYKDGESCERLWDHIKNTLL